MQRRLPTQALSSCWASARSAWAYCIEGIDGAAEFPAERWGWVRHHRRKKQTRGSLLPADFTRPSFNLLLPSPSPGKQGWYTAFATRRPICRSTPAGRLADSPGAVSTGKACLRCNRSSGKRLWTPVFLRPSLRSKFVFLFLPLRTYLLGRFPANYPGLVPLRFCHPEVASPSIASRLVPAHIMLLREGPARPTPSLGAVSEKTELFNTLKLMT